MHVTNDLLNILIDFNKPLGKPHLFLVKVVSGADFNEEKVHNATRCLLIEVGLQPLKHFLVFKWEFLSLSFVARMSVFLSVFKNTSSPYPDILM